ncbi:MAG: bifunctional phosphoribosylaminoimidazolecarboxamide formyltransferase/IMP cyclohydrolase PurH [Bacteroidetes bacterium]|nr:MAG: bifunctional phosphoribosylaminoimidazolecarboxamide formyltransferase/IMP cyclohydrolase PurH [Bacteroidota bacterium]
MKKIQSALISVFDKENLDQIALKLNDLSVQIYSTGGTQKYIENLGVPVIAVEDLTDYPSILGGRVKTLHPKVFGGILSRRDLEQDQTQVLEYDIPNIDLVIVDLYPFRETVASGANHEEIIEKIDIGGISLIRAAAKNYKDVVIVPSKDQYQTLLDLLEENNGSTNIDTRKQLATEAFHVSSEYDIAIYNYLSEDQSRFKISLSNARELRYGENPHQKGIFYGDLDALFEKLHGKELSYNNLLDIDAAINLMAEFKSSKPTFAILKHNNACGLAMRDKLKDAYLAALAGDPVSAFGGILITNCKIDYETAQEINNLFCEVVIAPDFDIPALEILRSKKNRILLIQKQTSMPDSTIRTALNGILYQDKDQKTDKPSDFKQVTTAPVLKEREKDLEFAAIISKHTKSNTIVLAKNMQLLASGTGQTSRIDALKQAIAKAQNFGFDLEGSVMASDAFFPFPDSVEIADKAGIKAVIQPGGSIKDQLSIDYCNEHGMSMVFTGTRHFKH